MLMQAEEADLNEGPMDALSRIVRIFLESNMSIILIVKSVDVVSAARNRAISVIIFFTLNAVQIHRNSVLTPV